MPITPLVTPDPKDASKKPKNKAHFVGVRRPSEKTEEKKRPTSTVKNQWVKSKTHPKKDKKEKEQPKEQATDESPNSDVPYFNPSGALSALSRRSSIAMSSLLLLDDDASKEQPSSDDSLDPQDTEQESSYPLLGKDAPRGHLFFTGDWLFWRTRQSGMEFAVHGASASFTAPFPHSATSKLNFDLTSGFRVGFGVHLPNDGWDITVNYTDFRPKASKSIDGSIFPLFLYNPPSLATSADAEWKITFQEIDIEIGRAYYIGKTLSFRPFIGMIGGWIDQHAHITYEGGNFPSGEENRIAAHNHFKGAGPRFGLGSNWHLGSGLSLFGNGAAALAVGHFDLKNHQTQDDIETIHLESDLNLVSPVLQFIAGIAWDRNYDRGERHLGLSAGFETLYWWRQNQLERFTDSITPLFVRADSDLAFYGLTLRGRFDF